jgi:MFS family permease
MREASFIAESLRPARTPLQPGRAAFAIRLPSLRGAAQNRAMTRPLPADGGTRAFRALSALTFAFAWVPVVWVHFTVTRGFSPDAYAALWATYYLAMVACELPWGWLADRIGRRPVLVAGPAVLALAFVLLGRCEDLAACHVLMAVVGAAHALISGADSAWLYDHLLAAGRGGDALAEETVAHRWRLFGVSALDVLGGLVAWRFGTPAAFDVAAGVMLLAALLATRLPEPRRTRGARLPRLSSLLAGLRAPGVAWVLGWFVAAFALVRVGFQLYQPTLLALGAGDLRLHGLLLAVLNLVAGLSAFFVIRIWGALGERRAAGLVLLLLSLSFGGLALGSAWLLAPLLALQQVAFAFLQPLGRTALNQRIPSAERASLLSVQSLLARLAFGALLFAGHWETAFTTTLSRTYFELAAAALLLAGFAVFAHPDRKARLETAPDG